MKKKPEQILEENSQTILDALRYAMKKHRRFPTKRTRYTKKRAEIRLSCSRSDAAVFPDGSIQDVLDEEVSEVNEAALQSDERYREELGHVVAVCLRALDTLNQ